MKSSRYDADSPTALAYRMAGYMKDARYIAAYIAQEYGQRRAPSIRAVEGMMARHAYARRPRADGLQRELAEGERRQAALNQQAADRVRAEAERIAKQEADAAAAFAALPHIESKGLRIVTAVAYAFTLAPAAVTSKARNRRNVLARQVAIRLIRNLRRGDQLVYSLPAIGRLIGGRDHSTIKWSLDTFDAAMAAHPEAHEIYQRLKELAQ